MDNEDKHCTSVRSHWRVSGTTGGDTQLATSDSTHVSASTPPTANACDCTMTQQDEMYNREERSCNVTISTTLNLVKCEDNTEEFDDINSLPQPRNTTRQPRGTGDDVSSVTKTKQEKTDLDDYDRDGDKTRHWVVGRAGVLKEVKVEPSRVDCNEGIGRNQQIGDTNDTEIDETPTDLKHNPAKSTARGRPHTRTRRRSSSVRRSPRVKQNASVSLAHGDSLIHDGSRLKVHLTTYTGPLYICRWCGKSFAFHGVLKKHELSHTRATREAALARSDQVKRHESLDTDVKPFTCTTCGKAFKRELQLKFHQRYHHTPLRRFPCATCGKSFVFASYLKKHVLIHTGTRPFACVTCGKRFIRSHHLKQHEVTHADVKPFTCTTCGKTFSLRGTLKEHETLHTGVKHFTCTKCGKSFFSSYRLRRHEKIHTDVVTPLSCATCGKSFAQSKDLKVHEKIHTEVELATCTTCGESFKRLFQLKKHEMIHKNVKPLLCKTCGKSFLIADTLRNHEKYHMRGRRFKCVPCGKSFVYPSQLKLHERTHTGSKPVT